MHWHYIAKPWYQSELAKDREKIGFNESTVERFETQISYQQSRLNTLRTHRPHYSRAQRML